MKNNKKKKCNAKYVITNNNDCPGIVWETPKGKIITLQDNFSIKDKIEVISVETGETVEEFDLLSIFEEILYIQ